MAYSYPTPGAAARFDALWKLDPCEEHFHIPGPVDGRRLFLRFLPTSCLDGIARPVLYVHGGTFPSALSVAHRFDGSSWRDELVAAGFDVWGLDFYGFGASDPYPEMSLPPHGSDVLGVAEVAAHQLETAVHFICAYHNVPRISVIAHSWGSIVAARFAAAHADLISRLVLFAPIVPRSKKTPPPSYEAWRLISLDDQWTRFTADVPPAELPVLSGSHFEEWGELYLDTDCESRTRSPPSVKVPSGPWYDIGRAWCGELLYNPGLIRAPVAIIRGEWDSYCTDADALWLFNSLRASPIRRDIKISRATHLMHLEVGRHALYRETERFLLAGDEPSAGLSPREDSTPAGQI